MLSSWSSVAAAGPLAVPDVLTFLPLQASEQQQQQKQETGASSQLDHSSELGNPGAAQQQASSLAGLLLISSRCSSSQVVGVPTAALSSSSSSSSGDMPRLPWPLLQSALLPSLAGAQAVMVLQDPTGVALLTPPITAAVCANAHAHARVLCCHALTPLHCGTAPGRLWHTGTLPEQQLLVACGAGPRGKLALLRSGVGLTPLLLDGAQLPVRCRRAPSAYRLHFIWLAVWLCCCIAQHLSCPLHCVVSFTYCTCARFQCIRVTLFYFPCALAYLEQDIGPVRARRACM
jgi:hypothetical protein